MRPVLASLGVLLLLPTIASAEVLAEVVGLFNVFVGIMLALAFLIYAAGMVVWLIRLGAWPSYRDEAIGYLKWPVAIMFVLIVLLGAVQLIQKHLAQATFVLGVCIVIGAVWVIMTLATKKGGGDEDGH